MSWSGWTNLNINLNQTWNPFEVTINSGGKIEAFYTQIGDSFCDLYSFRETSENAGIWSNPYL